MNSNRAAREARRRQRDPQAVEARNQRLNKLNKDSRELLESVADRLPSDLVASCRSDSDAGEWANSVDELCAILVKRQIKITQVERDLVANLLGQFNPPVEGYPYISDPDGVLSELNVAT